MEKKEDIHCILHLNKNVQVDIFNLVSMTNLWNNLNHILTKSKVGFESQIIQVLGSKITTVSKQDRPL
jgi:hypothetical protein